MIQPSKKRWQRLTENGWICTKNVTCDLYHSCTQRTVELWWTTCISNKLDLVWLLCSIDSSKGGNSCNFRKILSVSVIGVCIDTYVFYQSVLEKKRPIGQVYRKGHNVMSQTPVVSMTTRLIVFFNNSTRISIVLNWWAFPAMIRASLETGQKETNNSAGKYGFRSYKIRASIFGS